MNHRVLVFIAVLLVVLVGAVGFFVAASQHQAAEAQLAEAERALGTRTHAHLAAEEVRADALAANASAPARQEVVSVADRVEELERLVEELILVVEAESSEADRAAEGLGRVSRRLSRFE